MAIVSPFFRLLGIPAVIRGDKVLTSFRSHRIPALVGLLATQPGPRRREAVAAELWPEAATEEGRHNLRQTVLYVKQLLGENSILGDRQTLELSPEVKTDVQFLLRSHDPLIAPNAAAEAAEEIARHAYAEFLEGYDDEWILSVRAQCSDAYLHALILLANRDLPHQPERALQLVDRAIRAEPLLDAPRALRIRALRRLGREDQARREVDTYAKLLADELGTDPSHLVEDALVEEIAAAKPNKAADDEAVAALLAGNRPSQGLQLALAQVPLWIARGQARSGIVTLTKAIEATQGRTSPLVEHQARFSLARLLAADSRLFEASQVLDKLLEEDTAVHANALIHRARLSASVFRATEASSYIHQALDQIEPEPLETKIDAYRCALEVALQLGEWPDCEDHATRCIESALAIGDWEAIGSCLTILAFARLRSGHTAEAREAGARALQAIEGKESPRAAFLRTRAYRLVEEIGDLEAAEEGYRRGIREAYAFDDRFGLSVVLTYLGDLLTRTGHFTEALASHYEALEVRKALGEKLGQATSLRGVGAALLAQGNLEEARVTLRQCSRLFLDCDDLPGHASALLLLAQVAAAHNEAELAHRLALRARDLLLRVPSQTQVHAPYLKEADRLLKAIPA